MKNKNHPDRKEYLNWAKKDTGGKMYDPEYFDLIEVNKALAKIK